MRRARSKLEVSTFPFLAVLLCVMGSLLLLLFIMDRRGKIAAQYRSVEVLAERKARTKAEEEARQAEWEKAQEQLHRSLVEQQQQLLVQSNELERDRTGASKKLALFQTQHGNLEEQIKGEAAQISLLQLVIENHKAQVQQADQKETVSKKQLLAAARELAELERAFQQLRALRERDKQTYSVVPYRGKRGDIRPPIYVECDRNGVIFHPGQKPFERWDFTAAALRSEVERRSGPLVVQKAKEKSPSAEQPPGAYVLFLVRPDGIASYYKAQSALKGYQLDFGYELVDTDWVLDFGGETHAKTTHPTKSGSRPKPFDVPEFFGGAGAPIAKGPLVAPPGGANARGTPGSGSGNSSGPGVPNLPLPGFSNDGRGIGSDKTNIGSGNSPVPPPPGNNPAVPGKGPSFVPIAKPPQMGPTASAGLRPEPIVGLGGLHASCQPPPLGFGGTKSTGQPANRSGSDDPKSGGSSSPPLNPINVPMPGNSVAQKPTTQPGSRGTSSDGATADGAPADADAPTGPRQKSFPAFGADTGRKPPPAPPLSKLLGNKDFVITIDCHADYITVTPSGLTFRWTSSNLQETDKAFVQTVATLIERRQASVRQGEPPYRPLVRFQVPTEGLRTYYHAYPLLETLRVPMTRENVSE